MRDCFQKKCALILRESDMWQYEERAQNPENSRSHYHHKGRNNNNNNSQANVFTLWDPPHPATCDSEQVCRWVFNMEHSCSSKEFGDELLSFPWTDATLCMIAALWAHIAQLPRPQLSWAMNLLSRCSRKAQNVHKSVARRLNISDLLGQTQVWTTSAQCGSLDSSNAARPTGARWRKTLSKNFLYGL